MPHIHSSQRCGSWLSVIPLVAMVGLLLHHFVAPSHNSHTTGNLQYAHPAASASVGSNPLEIESDVVKRAQQMERPSIAKMRGMAGNTSWKCNVVEELAGVGDILTRGSEQSVHSSGECLAHCRTTPGCNLWHWCDDPSGCWDSYGQPFPHHGCQLRREPPHAWGLPGPSLLQAWQPSTYASGYLQVPSNGSQAYLRLHNAPQTAVLIATVLPARSCAGERGHRWQLMALLNKQDYARYHSYEFHVAAQPADPRLQDSWSKVRFLNKLLHEVPRERAEWVMYLSPESVFDVVALQPPFEMYDGHELIANQVTLPDGVGTGISSYVMLLHNSDWSREFLDRITALALQPGAGSMGQHGGPLRDEDAMARVLRNATFSAGRVRSEAFFCFNCDWRRVHLDLSAQATTALQTTFGEANKKWKLFITTFFECPVCTMTHVEAPLSATAAEQCMVGMEEHFRFHYCQYRSILDAIEADAKLGDPLAPAESTYGSCHVPLFRTRDQARPSTQEAARVLVAGKDHTTASAEQCFHACRAGKQGCNFWVWCGHAGGCDDGGSWMGRYPMNACELMAVPELEAAVEPNTWVRGPLYSTAASGYLTGPAWPQKGMWSKKAPPRVALLTSMASVPCDTPLGDYNYLLSVQNKQDYARLHGFELHVGVNVANRSLKAGPWHKIGMLNQVMHDTSAERAEWFLLLDSDTMFGDLSFVPPLELYRGKDLVLWGDVSEVAKGNSMTGLNTGIMLIRNSEWSRQFVRTLQEFGVRDTMTFEEVFREALPTYDYGLADQNGVAYMLKQDAAAAQRRLLPRVRFEDQYCINCWWGDLDKPWVRLPAFIVHYAGCQLCSGVSPQELNECEGSFRDLYVQSYCVLAEARAATAAAAAGGGIAAQRRSLSRNVLR